MSSLHHMSPNSDVEGDLPEAKEKVAPEMMENSEKTLFPSIGENKPL